MLDPFISKGEDLMGELASYIGYHMIDRKDISMTLIEVYEWISEAIGRIN